MTKVEAVRHYFLAQPNRWIDGRELSTVGGAYAWRSRVSDVRRQFGMTIENQQRWINLTEGRGYTVSEYRYCPPTPSPVVADATGDSSDWGLTS